MHATVQLGQRSQAESERKTLRMDPKAILLLLLTQFAVCLCAKRESTKEELLYESAEWKDETQPMIFTKPRGLPTGFLKALEHAVVKSHVILYEVTCSDGGGAGEVCSALARHRIAVRVDGRVRGLATPPHGYDSEPAFVVAVLEHLLNSSITLLTSYADFEHYTTDYAKHLLLLAPDTEREEYAALLAAVLTWPLPVAVAMTANVLPLSRRPHYTSHPPPLQLWYVEREDSEWFWYPFQNPEQFLQHSLDLDSSPTKLVTDFVQRLQYPIIVHYDNDAALASLFSGFALHLAVIFPGLSGASDIDPLSLAVGVAQKTFMNYAIVLADRSRDSDYGSRLYITDLKPLPHVVMLPYGRETNIVDHEVKGDDLEAEVQSVANILDSMLLEYPKVGIGEAGFVGLGPSVTTVMSLKFLMEGNNSVLAYFCQQDDNKCIDKAYSNVRDVLGVVRRTELGRSLAGHVVMTPSLEELKERDIDSLPALAMFSKTTKKWTVASGDIFSRTDVVQFLSRLTDMSELKENAEDLFQAPQPMDFAPPIPTPLQEEEQINLVVRSLRRPTIPDEIQLSTDNFERHISKFLKSVVVFCVKWSIRCKAFFHHLMAAHQRLDKTFNISLALVKCDDYTDLCTRLNITTYPTVLVFTPSTLHTPTPLTGSLDSSHLLVALGQPSKEPDTIPPLTELTPSSLPALLGEGGLKETLLLWCDGDTGSELASEFLNQVSRESQAQLVTTAWINSTKYSKLLSYILPDGAKFPSVAAINFKQHSVYHLAVAEDLKVFKEKLSSFLSMLSQQTLTPTGHLEERAWPPLQPPIQFPSVEDDEVEFHGDGFDEGMDFYQGEFDEEKYFSDGEFELKDHGRLRRNKAFAQDKPHPSTPPTKQQQHQHTEL